MTALAQQGWVSFPVVLLRILPVVVLSPVLGGTLVPGPIRLVVAVVVAAWIQGACGVEISPQPVGWPFVAVEQLSLGTVMGLATTWSFDAASAAGRWIDVLRGSSAEASNPATGSRDSAAGALLHRLLLANVCAAGATPLLVGELARSFKWCPPGDFALDADILGRWVAGLVAAFESGLVIAAPFAVLELSVDLGVAFLQRVAPAVSIVDAALPARLLLGGLLFAWELVPALTRLAATGPSLQVLVTGGLP